MPRALSIVWDTGAGRDKVQIVGRGPYFARRTVQIVEHGPYFSCGTVHIVGRGRCWGTVQVSTYCTILIMWQR